MTTVHTYPVNDLIEHNADGEDCPCGPTVEAVFRADGSNGWHVIHHSLDGREKREAEELRRRIANDDGTRHDLDDVATEFGADLSTPRARPGGMCVWCRRTTATEGGDPCPVSPMCDQMVYPPEERP